MYDYEEMYFQSFHRTPITHAHINLALYIYICIIIRNFFVRQNHGLCCHVANNTFATPTATAAKFPGLKPQTKVLLKRKHLTNKY